jgi:uncharacterized membrane protein YccF (DUF307 family)
VRHHVVGVVRTFMEEEVMEFLILFYFIGGLVLGLAALVALIVGCVYLIVVMFRRMSSRNAR